MLGFGESKSRDAQDDSLDPYHVVAISPITELYVRFATVAILEASMRATSLGTTDARATFIFGDFSPMSHHTTNMRDFPSATWGLILGESRTEPSFGEAQ